MNRSTRKAKKRKTRSCTTEGFLDFPSKNSPTIVVSESPQNNRSSRGQVVPPSPRCPPDHETRTRKHQGLIFGFLGYSPTESKSYIEYQSIISRSNLLPHFPLTAKLSALTLGVRPLGLSSLLARWFRWMLDFLFASGAKRDPVKPTFSPVRDNLRIK